MTALIGGLLGRFEGLPRQLREDLAGSALARRRQLLRGLEHVFVNIQRYPHSVSVLHFASGVN